MSNNEHRTFEDCLDIINLIIKKRRHKWMLNSITSLDFDDVSQILRLHIWKKWHLYDQNQSLEAWLTTVITRQLINLARNVYHSVAKPCLKCPFYEGNELCSQYGNVSTKCDVYAHWVKSKKSAHDIKLPLPMENHQNEVFDIKANHIDIQRTADNIHQKMKNVLKPLEWFIYKELYIKHTDEKDVAKLLGFKTTEKNRPAGYKQLNNIRKSIVAKVKEVLYGGTIDIVN